MTPYMGLSYPHNSPAMRIDWDSIRRSRLLHNARMPELTQVDSIRYAVGGDVIQFKTPALTSPQTGGGERNNISEFSRASRLRLLTFINSINRTEVEAVQFWFVTLTYPREWPECPKVWKKHLQAFQKRLTRSYGKLPVVWKLEPQKRGAPHFHLLIIIPPDFIRGLRLTGCKRVGNRMVDQWRGGQLGSFRQWLSRQWFEIVDSGDAKHLRAGTNCEPLQSWRRIVSYASKYLAKTCLFITEHGETQAVGRYWGVWQRPLFPITWQSTLASPRAWAVLRRSIRRYHKSQQRTLRHISRSRRSATVFVPSQITERLMREVDPIWQSLERDYGSIHEWMRVIKYEGSINDWYRFGEAERQALHSNSHGRNRNQASAHVYLN